MLPTGSMSADTPPPRDEPSGASSTVQSPPPLRLATILAATELFAERGWQIESDKRIDFLKVTQCLSSLTAAQSQLALDLLRDFQIFQYQDYEVLATDLVEKLEPRLLASSSSEVVLIPLRSPADEQRGAVKSGAAVCYPIAQKLRELPTLRTVRKVRSYDSVEAFAKTRASRSRATILLTDDFIGTGKSATDCIGHLKELAAVTGDEIVIAALVSMKRGIEAVKNAGAETVAAIEVNRGISDSPRFAEQPQMSLETMLEVEAMLGVHADYSLGYQASEALVKMIRIPNNTFPVFWWNSRKVASWVPIYDRN